jgi:hypothetical protein
LSVTNNLFLVLLNVYLEKMNVNFELKTRTGDVKKETRLLNLANRPNQRPSGHAAPLLCSVPPAPTQRRRLSRSPASRKRAKTRALEGKHNPLRLRKHNY